MRLEPATVLMSRRDSFPIFLGNKLRNTSNADISAEGDLVIQNTAELQNRLNEGGSPLTTTMNHIQSSYKLIDFGTAVGVNDEDKVELNQNMRTLNEMIFVG